MPRHIVVERLLIYLSCGEVPARSVLLIGSSYTTPVILIHITFDMTSAVSQSLADSGQCETSLRPEWQSRFSQ